MDYLEPFRNIVCSDWICLSAEVHFFLPTLDHGYPMVSFVSKWKQFGVCVCVCTELLIYIRNEYYNGENPESCSEDTRARRQETCITFRGEIRTSRVLLGERKAGVTVFHCRIAPSSWEKASLSCIHTCITSALFSWRHFSRYAGLKEQLVLINAK